MRRSSVHWALHRGTRYSVVVGGQRVPVAARMLLEVACTVVGRSVVARLLHSPGVSCVCAAVAFFSRRGVSLLSAAASRLRALPPIDRLVALQVGTSTVASSSVDISRMSSYTRVSVREPRAGVSAFSYGSAYVLLPRLPFTRASSFPPASLSCRRLYPLQRPPPPRL